MSNQPELATTQLRSGDWLILNACLYGLFVGVLGPLTSVTAFWFECQKYSPKRYLLFSIPSWMWIGLLAQIPIMQGILSFRFWLASVPLFPLATIVLKGLYMFSYFTKPKTLQEQLSQAQETVRNHNSALSDNAQRRPEAPTQEGHLCLGSIIKGDLLPQHSNLGDHRGWLFLEEGGLNKHLFILGTTGAGKSETIKRLVYEILTTTDRNIYFVDGKGDGVLANDIRALAHQHGRGTAPIFRLGFESFGAVYDGFRGHKEAVDNRLRALVGVEDAEGDAQYYADINRNLLQLICYAPDGPPRSFEQVRERLNRSWLKKAYAHHKRELDFIEEFEERHIQSLAYRIVPFEREFGACIGDDGFALEETRCALFSINTMSVGDTGRRFLKFFIEDLKDFIAERTKQLAHKSVLIIDEFGQFDNSNITPLLMLARSRNMGVVLATQTIASLGDEETKSNILDNSGTKLLMLTELSEEMVERAGTKYHLESSVQYDETGMTGLGSARVQHTFKIDPNELGSLRAGEAFVIRKRHAVKIQISQIGEVEHIAPQVEEQRQREEPTKQPEAKLPPRL